MSNLIRPIILCDMETSKEDLLANKERLVKDTVRILDIPKARFEPPLVVLFVGGPASGKTFLARELQKHLPFCRITSDVIRAFLVPSPTFYAQETKLVFELVDAVVEDLVTENVNVLYDANLKRRSEREKVKSLVEKRGGWVFVIYTICKEEIAFKRIQERNKKIQAGEARGFIIDREYYRFVLNTLEPPSSTEVSFTFDSTYGSGQIKRLLLKLKKNLGKRLET